MMSIRLARAIVRRYPIAWRARYEREMLALIEDTGINNWLAVDLVRGLIAEWGRVVLTAAISSRAIRSVVRGLARSAWFVARVVLGGGAITLTASGIARLLASTPAPPLARYAPWGLLAIWAGLLVRDSFEMRSRGARAAAPMAHHANPAWRFRAPEIAVLLLATLTCSACMRWRGLILFPDESWWLGLVWGQDGFLVSMIMASLITAIEREKPKSTAPLRARA